MKTENKTWIYGILTAALFLLTVVVLVRSCERPDSIVVETDHIKTAIAKIQAKKDSVKPIIQIQTVEVVKYRERWHRLKDTIYIPSGCDTVFKTIVSACDSVIQKDSILISSLQFQARLDSSIISDQGKIIRADSLTILGLNKEVRKQKRHKRIALIAAGVIGALSLTK